MKPAQKEGIPISFRSYLLLLDSILALRKIFYRTFSHTHKYIYIYEGMLKWFCAYQERNKSPPFF